MLTTHDGTVLSELEETKIDNSHHIKAYKLPPISADQLTNEAIEMTKGEVNLRHKVSNMNTQYLRNEAKVVNGERVIQTMINDKIDLDAVFYNN